MNALMEVAKLSGDYNVIEKTDIKGINNLIKDIKDGMLATLRAGL